MHLPPSRCNADFLSPDWAFLVSGGPSSPAIVSTLKAASGVGADATGVLGLVFTIDKTG